MKTLQECVEANVRNISKKTEYWISINCHPQAPYTKKEVFDAVCTIFDLAGARYRKGSQHRIVLFPDK